MGKKLIAFTIKNASDDDYQKINNKINSVVSSWVKIDETLYLTITNHSSVNLREILKEIKTSGIIEMIFISDWEHPSAWVGLNKEVEDWIKNN